MSWAGVSFRSTVQSWVCSFSSAFVDSPIFSYFSRWCALCPYCWVMVMPELLASASADRLHQFPLVKFSLRFDFSLMPSGSSPHLNACSYQTACIFPFTLQRDKCGELIYPTTLSSYRLDHLGQKAIVPDLLCRYRAKHHHQALRNSRKRNKDSCNTRLSARWQR